jgi:hypothetical protein
MIMFGAGVASAGPHDVVGKTYSEAAAALSGWGFNAKVGPTVGGELSQGACVVVAQRDMKPPSNGSSQAVSDGKTIVVLSLNCNASVASATNPGNSAASPEGRAAAKLRQKVEWEQSPDGQAWCEQSKKDHGGWNWDDPSLAGCKTKTAG